MESLLKKLFGSKREKQAPALDAEPAPETPQQAAVRKIVAQAQTLFDAGNGADALRLTHDAAAAGVDFPGLYFLQGLCLDKVGRHVEALASFRTELAFRPEHEGAKAWEQALSKALAKPVGKQITSAERPFHTTLPGDTLQQIQQSLHNYHYRGVPMLKNPFDVALYPMLIWKTRPRTIIEIGSKSGGSGLWFGDVVQNFGLDAHVYSYDIVQVTDVKHSRVSFEQADGRALGKTLTPVFLASLPRPWLVIEDADHAYETSIAVLKFFGPLMQPGEYLVVEDGIISDLSRDPTYMSGPHKALKEYLPQHPEFEIDGEFCDFFGYNLTWCTNGFLRRKALDEKANPPPEIFDISPIRSQIQKGELESAFTSLNALKARRVSTAGVDYLRALYFIRKKQPHGAIEALKEELRYFPENKDAIWLLSKLESENPVKATLGNREFQELFATVRRYTMVGEARLLSLYTLARDVCERDVPGNFVECGVAAGGSSALLAAVITRHSKRPRILFSCDTFEGMPEASGEDRHEGVQAESTGWGKGTCSASEKSLLEAAALLAAEKAVRPIKGLFGDTLPKHRGEIGEIAFLHVDGDWYSSTQDILVNLFDQVEKGGRIQIDDYGYWEGCKKAVTDFAAARSLIFKFNVIDETGVWIVK